MTQQQIFQNTLDLLTSDYTEALTNRDAAKTLEEQSHWNEALVKISISYAEILEEYENYSVAESLKATYRIN